MGILERERPARLPGVSISSAGSTLEFLVENMGRVNYGPELNDRKGITGGVLLGQQFLFGWMNYPIPLDDLSRLRFSPGLACPLPGLLAGAFRG